MEPVAVLQNAGVQRRGVVWIAPDGPVPQGSLVDPADSRFWVSWQHDSEGLLTDDVIAGAEAAIEWGRMRSDVVRIRLGSTEDSYFSAGAEHADDLPLWPPDAPPADGWWSPPPEGWWPPHDPGDDAGHRIGVLRPEIRRTDAK